MLRRQTSTHSPKPNATIVTSLTTMDRPNDDLVIISMYESVLDHLLTPPQVKEQLMQSQSIDKKWQTVTMHKQLFQDSKAQHVIKWSESDIALLSSLQRSHVPDLQSLSKLRLILSSANLEMMESFLEAEGVSILLTAIENRICKNPMSELDTAILYEILNCFKVVMNNDTGMEGFLDCDSSVGIICKCLRFDNKLITLLVLEMLSVCSYYSEPSATMVIEGMRSYARSNKELPFYCLVKALQEQDIEVKANVMQFINSMIMGVPDISAQTLLHGDFTRIFLNEKYEQASSLLNKEIIMMKNYISSGNRLKVWSLKSIFGPKSKSLKKIEAITNKRSHLLTYTQDNNQFSQSMNIIEEDNNNLKDDSIEFNEEYDNFATDELLEHDGFEVFSENKTSLFVNPNKGSMAGLLTAAKNVDKIENKLIEMVGGKKTKRRWFELNRTSFRWCHGHEKEVEFKGNVTIASIIGIRNFATDQNICDACKYTFEIETTERVYALGCETAVDKDNWVTALRSAYDHHQIMKGVHKIKIKELSYDNIIKYSEMYYKQGTVLRSIQFEHRKVMIATCGLDLSDVNILNSYIKSECIAAGNNAYLLSILTELLLIPTGANSIWELIVNGLKKLREVVLKNDDFSDNSKDIFHSNDIGAIPLLLKRKAEMGGTSYAHVNKLALSTIIAENECVRLQAELKTIQEQLEKNQHFNNNNNNNNSNNNVIQSELHMIPINVNSIAITPSNLNKFSIYDDMRSKGITEEAIKQKMKIDKISENDINSYFSTQTLKDNTSSVNNNNENNTNKSNEIMDEKYIKYEKMRKILPEGAVRQKMTVDGISEIEINQFFMGTLGSGTSQPSAGSNTSGMSPSAPPLPIVNEKFSKYDKMKKILPEGALRQKMKADGISDNDINQYFDPNSTTTNITGTTGTTIVTGTKLPPPDIPPEGMLMKPKIKPNIKLKGFFWTKLKTSEINPNVVWYNLPEHNLTSFDQKEIEEWFTTVTTTSSQNNNNNKSNNVIKQGGVTAIKLFSVLDSQRTQNILIFMGKIRMDSNQIMNLIIELDPDRLTQELTSSIISILPTAEELVAIKSYTSSNNLDRASQLIFNFNRIPRLVQRMESHDIIFSWMNNANAVNGQIITIQRACEELKTSQKSVDKLLSIILALGNYINGDTPRGQAYGVKIDVFSKISLMKSSYPHNGTLMNFIAHQLEQNYQNKLINSDLHLLANKWIAIHAAGELSFRQIKNDVNALDEKLIRLNNEFIRIKDGKENVGLDGELETVKGLVTNPLYRRLDNFLTQSKPKLLLIKNHIKEVEEQVDQIMNRYCEHMNDNNAEDDPCKTFFSYLSLFSRNLHSSYEENITKKILLEKSINLNIIQNNHNNSHNNDNNNNKTIKNNLNDINIDNKRVSRNRDKPTENIFNKFHSSQEASSDSVVAEFKQKLFERMQRL
eukprot:gene7971-10811_t